MSIKLVITDMDGTLFHGDEVLPSIAREFSGLLKEKGILFTVATGRSRDMAKKFIQQLKPTAPCIYSNGALVRSETEIIDTVNITLFPLRSLLEFCQSLDFTIAVNCDYIGDFVFKHTAWTQQQNILLGNYCKEHQLTETEWNSLTVQKILIKDATSRIDRIHDSLSALSDYCSFIKYTDRTIEIMPKNIDKANGVLSLAEYLDISLNDILTIGDNLNDIGMFKTTGYSAAVCNASQSAKAAARYICSQEIAFGVSEAIQKFC